MVLPPHNWNHPPTRRPLRKIPSQKTLISSHPISPCLVLGANKVVIINLSRNIIKTLIKTTMKNKKKTLSKEGKASVKFWSNFTDSEFLLALMFVTTGDQIITLKDIKLAEFNMEANKDFRKAIHEEALKLDKLETKPKK